MDLQSHVMRGHPLTRPPRSTGDVSGSETPDPIGPTVEENAVGAPGPAR